MTDDAPRLIALDWGTSSLRSYLLGDGGAVLDTRRLPLGIMQVEGGDFAGAFAKAAGDWRARWPGLPAIAAGMIGSAQGWVEAPYAPVPAGLDELARGLVPVPGAGLHIVPGVVQRGDAPNVMRGEETQIAGALPEGGGGLLVLPGTHSKWVEVAEGRIRRFDTYMTGELFAVLRRHSILGRFVREEDPPPPDDVAREAFARGVAALRAEGASLSPLLFSARALVLTGGLPPEASLDYLSGLLIGDELRGGLAGHAGSIALIGDAALCARYETALAIFGVAGAGMPGDTAAAGLWRIAERAGLTRGPAAGAETLP
ncbi:2-dehydro-3-deoxygalactonokinase [Roseomonas nepalensis]|uniref:2-dehydro-3-deoxygalactonokinase n=1 Tax=Muricoccus nepalensis TaxID=1854500 RepID=A0A502FCU0_9PROT|nr:2-dehydro-3-deoxygalactonokinase [Roseomonas nepalensis]